MEKNKISKAIELYNMIESLNQQIKKVSVSIDCGNYQNFFLLTGIDALELKKKFTKNIISKIKAVRNKLQNELDEL